MKKFGLILVAAATILLTACGGNSSNTSKFSSHKETAAEMSSKAAVAASKRASKDPYIKLSKSMRDRDDDIAGVNGVHNDDSSPLVIVLNGYSAYSSMVSSTNSQKYFLLRLMDTVDHIKDNPKAANGLVITGGYIKMDDGVIRPTFTAYFDSTSLASVNFSSDVLNAKNPTDLFAQATNYNVLRAWFEANGPDGGLGLFKKAGTEGYADAPEWLTNIMNGKTRIVGRGYVKDSQPYSN